MAKLDQVDFYILDAQDAQASAIFSCRLAEKVYGLGHRIHLRAGSAASAAELDDLLWTFRQGSFVPHELARPGEQPRSPITIGQAGDDPPQADLLINLAGSLPAHAAEFKRVAEIVGGSTESKALGRVRFQAYKRTGVKLVMHEVGAES